MSDVEFLLEIVAKLRDEASPKIDALKAKIDSLKATQDAEGAEKDLGRAVDDTGRKRDESRKRTEAHSRATSAGRSETERATEALRQHGDTTERTASSLSKTTSAHNEMIEGLRKAREEAEGASRDNKDYDQSLRSLVTSSRNFRKEIDTGTFSSAQAKRGLKEYGSEIDSLSKRVDRGGESWRDARNEAEKLDKYLKKGDFGSTGGALSAFKRGDIGEGFEGIDAIGKKFDALGLRISGVSSFLRGFFDLAKIGFSQQLLTGVASLAGGLFSVASAAAQAGAAIGGVFISGLGQAIPMLSVVIASLERFKNILQAVSVNIQAEQQKFYAPGEKEILQLQQTSQLISSQQQLQNSYIQLSQAQKRVRDSQIALTEARYTASRQTEELALAEKNARLQAEGANLGLIEARRQLQIATEKGNVAGIQQLELAVKQAELQKESSRFAIPKAEREERLAKERKVEGQPAVIAAREGLEGSKLAVIQSRQAAEAAERQMKITEIQQKQRSSKETQYESQLKFLEKGMSPTELGLVNALTGIEKELRSADSPLKKITDYIVEPFTNAVERIRALLKTSSFLGPIDELAKAMGKGLGALEKIVYGPQGTSFFETMAKDAAQNIPIVVKSIEGIMKLFERIAEAADPAFKKLSEDWAKFWGALNKKYEGAEGLSRLEAFFNKSVEYAEAFGHLAGAIIGLFKALGHDAAPQGLSTVNSLTESIKSATSWVQSHGPEVTRFFRESKEGLAIFAEILLSIFVSIEKVFSLSSLRAFSGFINEIILPSLRDIVTVFGKLTTVVLEFFNLFGGPGRKILEIIGVSGLIVLGIVKISGAIVAIQKAWKVFVALVENTRWAALTNPFIAALTVVGIAIAAVMGAFSSGQKKNRITTEEATQALENQANALRAIKDLSAEYKSTELGVKEARGATTEAQQNLVRAKREKVTPLEGESTAEAAQAHKLRVEQAEREVSRAKLNQERTEREFKELPQKQKEEATKNREEIYKTSRIAYGQKSQQVKHEEEEIALTRAQYKEYKGKSPHELAEMALPPQAAQNVYNSLVKEEEKLGKSKEELAKIAETGSKNIQTANKEIGRSNKELAEQAPKINPPFEEAYHKFETAVRSGVVTVHGGAKEIAKIVDESLKKYGVKPSEISNTPDSRLQGLTGSTQAGTHPSGHAAGGWIPHRPGGTHARVGEGGHDEVILSTDPRHSSRSKMLLHQYMQRTFAEGGRLSAAERRGLPDSAFAGPNRTYPITDAGHVRAARMLAHGDQTILGNIRAAGYAGGGRVRAYPGPQGRVDEGVDYAGPGPIRAVLSGIVESVGKWAGWPGTGGMVYKTSKGLIYIMEDFVARVRKGMKIVAGQILGEDTGGAYGIETGWANASGTGPLVPYSAAQAAIDRAGGTAATAGGLSFQRFLATGAGQGTEGEVAGGIQAPIVKGGAQIGIVAQKALDIIAKGANIYLNKKAAIARVPSGGREVYAPAGKLGPPNKQEFLKFVAMYTGMPLNFIRAWQAHEQSGPSVEGGNNWMNIETGGSPFKGGSGAYGPTAKWMERHTPKQAASLTALWLERYQPQIVSAARRSAAAGVSALEQSGYAASHYNYESPGQFLSGYALGGIPFIPEPHRIILRHLRRKVIKLAEGGMAPWGGRPIPIIAHEGERIMNPAQYGETARLAGITPGGLDRHLGFDGRPRQSFQHGGLPTVTGGHAQPSSGGPAPFSLPGLSSLTLNISELANVNNLLKILKAISDGMTKIGRLKKPDEYEKTIVEFFKNIASAFESLTTAREYVKAKLTREAIGAEYKETGKFAIKGPGYKVKGNTGQVSLGAGGQVKIAEETFAILREENNLLQKEAAAIKTDRAKIASDIKHAKSKHAKELFKNEYNALTEKEKEIFELVGQNIEARYQAETQVIQTGVSEVNNAYQVFSAEKTTAVQKLQTLGEKAGGGGAEFGAIQKEIAEKAQGQIANLQPLLAKAKAIGNKELEASISQEIATLNQTINSAVAERISFSQTIIQRESGKREAISAEKLGISKVRAAEGKYGEAGSLEKEGLTEKALNLQTTKTEDIALREQAIREGDTAAAITLGEELNKNTTEIEENNLALKNNEIVMKELVISNTEAKGQLGTGVFGALYKGIETVGQTTGFINVPALLAAKRGEKGVLEGTQKELEGPTEVPTGIGVREGMSPTEVLAYLASPAGRAAEEQIFLYGNEAEKKALSTWVTNISNNSEAILQNTQEIAKLNGALNQPQTWSTAAQQLFRNSIFTGMGQLLPEYQNVLPPGARPEGLPKYGVATPGAAVGGPNIGAIHLTHPVEKLDPQLFGEELSFHIATTPSMG